MKNLKEGWAGPWVILEELTSIMNEMMHYEWKTSIIIHYHQLDGRAPLVGAKLYAVAFSQ